MRRLKFVIGCAIIVGCCLWLSYNGYQRGKTYYVTVTELLDASPPSKDKALRVGGDVQVGSIEREDGLSFRLSQGDKVLNVDYVGNDPIPDTFRDRAQAVVDGQYDAANGVFLAEKIQAKCASKYESAGQRTVGSFQGPAR